MNKYQISDETVNKILLHTAMTLPDRPSERGMKASELKPYFYSFIRKLADAVNTELENVVNGVSADIDKHNGNEESHAYLCEQVESLQEKDIELGDAIESAVKAHNESEDSHLDIREKIGDDIDAHNNSRVAHSDIRKLLETISEKADSAFNLANGKSKIHPMYDYGEFIHYVNTEPEKYNVGDMFIFENKQAPDFMLFEKDIEFIPGNDDIEITGETLPDDVDFLPGMRIVINGIRFIIQESGYDISKLATDEELRALGNEISELILALGERVNKAEDVLDLKADSFEFIESTASEITLEAHKEYSLGLITTLLLSLPYETSGIESIVNFRTGAGAPSFDAPSEIVFSGDDCSGGRFYPITHRIYEINIKEVLGVLVAKVGSCDYEVIE